MQKEKFKRFLKEVDFIGPSPILFTDAQPTFKTLLGGFISILTFFPMATVGIYFTILTLSRAHYTIIYNEVLNKNPNLPINADNPLMFGMLSLNGYPLTSEYVSFKATYHQLIGLNVSVTEITMVPCNENLISPDFKILISDKYVTLLPFFWCIKPEEAKPLSGVQGQVMDGGFYRIYTVVCTNGTSDVLCTNQTDIDYELANSFVLFAFKDHQIDHSKIYEPGVPYMK
jgi:hypothetical protein